MTLEGVDMQARRELGLEGLCGDGPMKKQQLGPALTHHGETFRTLAGGQAVSGSGELHVSLLTSTHPGCDEFVVISGSPDVAEEIGG